jgi:hypothetical protein
MIEKINKLSGSHWVQGTVLDNRTTMGQAPTFVYRRLTWSLSLN